MAELMTKFHCKKNGITEEISIYTTLDEVQNQGIGVTVDGIDGYMKYGSVDDINASQLNCKVGGESYGVHKIASAPFNVILLCYDVQTGVHLSSVAYVVQGGSTLYLNNDNAPQIEGYDFVLLEGIEHYDVPEGSFFSVYYIRNTVPNRALANWDGYYEGTLDATVDYVNTYNATNMSFMFFNAVSLVEIPKMNCSNVQSLSYFAYSCISLTSVPEMDTRKVKNMDSAFHGCSKLNNLGWDIDMSSCSSCRNMFTNCPATNIRLKNVPRSLNLSSIGTANYTVVNYLE